MFNFILYYMGLARYICLGAFTLIFSFDISAARQNVVISNIDNRYTFVPDNSGSHVVAVDVREETTFRAERKGDTALAISYYSDDVKLKKATGGNVTYGLMFDDDLFFDDAKGVVVAVDLKNAGSTGKSTVTTTYTKPEFFTKVLLTYPYAVESARYSFEMPASMASRYDIELRNIPDGLAEINTETKGNKVIKSVTISDLDEYKHFADAPSRNICAPMIVIRGHFADVDALYQYLYSYLDPVEPGASDVEAKARELTAGYDDVMAKIDTITRFVHDNIRYVAVENGELSHRPDHPSEVLRKLYGDCKGSASLLTAMFRAIGLDARRVWIGTNDIADRWSDNPSLSSGNHMISAVILDNDSIIFVDGTAVGVNVPATPGNIQGQQALIEGGEDDYILATVPVVDPSANMWRSYFTVDIAPDGVMSATGSMTLTGRYNAMIVQKMRSIAPANRDRYLDKVLLHEADGYSADVTGYNFERDSVVIAGRINNIGVVKKVGGEIYADLNPMPEISNYKFDLKERTEPGLLSANVLIETTYSLNIPDGMEAVDLPDDVNVDNGYLTASVTTRVCDRQVIRCIRLLCRRSLISVDALKGFNNDISRLQQACASVIILKPMHRGTD